MALVVKDRVRVSSSTSGTGPLTLGAAVTGFQDFSVIGNGNTTYYTIVDPTTGDWEVGIGTYSSTGPSLFRNTVLESSNGGVVVSFTSNAKDVFVTYPAERSVYVDGTSIAPATAARLGFSNLAQGSALSVLGVSGNATADLASVVASSDHQVLRRSGTAVGFGAVALNQANAVTGTLPVGNGGTGITSFGTGVATALGQNVTGSGGVVLANSPSLVTPVLGTPTSGNFSSGTFTWPTFNQNTTGNAATATTATNVTVTASSVDVTYKVPFTTSQGPSTGNYGLLQDGGDTFTYNPLTNVLTVGTVSGELSGNASTATALQTARTIGGVSFDGTANINLPGVNATGNQNTTGSAATLTTARQINGTNFNGSADITTANWGTARTLWGNSVDGSANITAPLRPAAGSAAAPAFSVSTDTDTGMFFPTANAVAFSGNGVERMRIDSSGKVGIGTSSPVSKLTVNGGVMLSAGAGSAEGQFFVYYASESNYAGIGSDINGSMLFNNGVSGVATRMLITNAGDVGIGEASPSGRLHVRGTGIQNAVYASGSSDGGWPKAQIIAEAASGSAFISLHVPGVTAPQLRCDGTVNTIDCVDQSNATFGAFRAAAFTVSSDYRIKENITDLSNALDRVALLKPKRFSFIEDSMMYRDGMVVDGFLAHEVSDAVPEAVSGEKDEVREDGTPAYQSIDQSKLVPLLTAAIQELKAELDSVKAKLNSLKGN